MRTFIAAALAVVALSAAGPVHANEVSTVQNGINLNGFTLNGIYINGINLNGVASHGSSAGAQAVVTDIEFADGTKLFAK